MILKSRSTSSELRYHKMMYFENKKWFNMRGQKFHPVTPHKMYFRVTSILTLVSLLVRIQTTFEIRDRHLAESDFLTYKIES